MDDQQHQNEAADGRSDLTEVLGAILEKNMEWQPIETAPKDGTRVFLWLPKIEGVQHPHRVESSWKDCWQCWGNKYDNGPAYNVIWVQLERWKEPKHEHIQPSHWMPLPEAPN